MYTHFIISDRDNFTCSTQMLRWVEAQNYCTSKNATLLTHKNTKNICHCGNKDNPYWTGIHIVTTLKTYSNMNRTGMNV